MPKPDKTLILKIESLPTMSERLDAYKAAGLDYKTGLPLGEQPKPRRGRPPKAKPVEAPAPVAPIAPAEPVAPLKITKVEELKNEPAPTVRVYGDLQQAFDYFNRTLFGGRLPHVLITLHRKKNTRGYFWAERFAQRSGEQITHEIALNPEADNMLGRTDREVLSTLVHEMCHLEQQAFGKPAKGGYHNAEWSAMMDVVGLTPEACNDPTKRTGVKVTHKIVEGGAYDVAYRELEAQGWVLALMERRFTEEQAKRAKKKTQSKTKFCCPSCEAAAWGKPTLRVECADCEEIMIAEEKE
jgi:predicted SprT family Zn-dependent metalloprotease